MGMVTTRTLVVMVSFTWLLLNPTTARSQKPWKELSKLAKARAETVIVDPICTTAPTMWKDAPPSRPAAEVHMRLVIRADGTVKSATPMANWDPEPAADSPTAACLSKLQETASGWTFPRFDGVALEVTVKWTIWQADPWIIKDPVLLDLPSPFSQLFKRWWWLIALLAAGLSSGVVWYYVRRRRRIRSCD